MSKRCALKLIIAVLFTLPIVSQANSNSLNIQLRIINHGQTRKDLKPIVKRLATSTELIYSQCRTTRIEVLEVLNLSAVDASTIGTENPFGITDFFTAAFYNVVRPVQKDSVAEVWNIHLVEAVDFSSPGWNIGALLRGYEIQIQDGAAPLLEQWAPSVQDSDFLPKDIHRRTVLIAMGGELPDATLAHELGHEYLETGSQNHDCGGHRCSKEFLMSAPINSISLSTMQKKSPPRLTAMQCEQLLKALN